MSTALRDNCSLRNPSYLEHCSTVDLTLLEPPALKTGCSADDASILSYSYYGGRRPKESVDDHQTCNQVTERHIAQAITVGDYSGVLEQRCACKPTDRLWQEHAISIPDAGQQQHYCGVRAAPGSSLGRNLRGKAIRLGSLRIYGVVIRILLFSETAKTTVSNSRKAVHGTRSDGCAGGAGEV